MTVWQKVKISSFLKVRESRIKPVIANEMGLKRLEKIDFSGQIYLADNKQTRTDMILVKSGDLVISGINVEKGALAVYEGKEDILATIHYSSYEYDSSKIDIEYLKWFLRSKIFRNILMEQVKGGIKTEIKPKQFLPLEISLPDIKIQKQIAQKINTVDNEVDGLVKIGQKNGNLVKQLRQSILQEAVQGKLVPQNPNDEPASELLKKIKAEKEKLIKDKVIQKAKELTPFNINEIPHTCPRSWEWTKIIDIAFVTKLAGFEYTKYINLQDDEEVPVIRAQNVKKGRLDETNLKYIDLKTSLMLNRCALTKESLLMTFIGAGIGDVAIFKKETRWHLAPNVAKIELFNNQALKIVSKFLLYYLMSDIGQSEIFKFSKATAQPSLSMGTIREIYMPLPPLSEQKRIVTKVDELMKLCDELEEQIKQSKIYSEQLMQSILQEAFNAEPAGVM